mmetsp:Transcript_41026/g.95797  ORF Transcript_41026/g.95797 Transcript_41026/m.95797 type:complete len:106 (+) Transcript_41026:341-658(+)
MDPGPNEGVTPRGPKTFDIFSGGTFVRASVPVIGEKLGELAEAGDSRPVGPVSELADVDAYPCSWTPGGPTSTSPSVSVELLAESSANALSPKTDAEEEEPLRGS